MSSRVVLAARPTRAMLLPTRNHAVVRGIQLSTTRYSGLKESSAEDPHSEIHKQDSLQKQKQGKGHWKPELASDSEEAVRADHGAAVDTATLQERTKRAAEETARSGTSMRDGL